MDVARAWQAALGPPEDEAAVWIKWSHGDARRAMLEYGEDMIKQEGPNRRVLDSGQDLRVWNILREKAGLPKVVTELWMDVPKDVVRKVTSEARSASGREPSRWAKAQLVGEWAFEHLVGDIPEATVVKTYLGPVSPVLTYKRGDLQGLKDVVLVWWPNLGDTLGICGWDYVAQLPDETENRISTWDLRAMFWWAVRNRETETDRLQAITGGDHEGQTRTTDRPGHAGAAGGQCTAGETSGQREGRDLPGEAGGADKGAEPDVSERTQAQPTGGQRVPGGSRRGHPDGRGRGGVRMTRPVVVADLETAAFMPAVLFDKLKAKGLSKIKKEVPKAANPKPATLERIEREYEERVANVGEEIMSRAALSPRTGRIVAIGIGVQMPDEPWAFHAKVAPEPEQEAELILHLDDLMSKLKDPLLVTFNGRRFDIPFLGARACVNNLGLDWRMPYGYQKNLHVDLMDYFPDGGLEDWCLVMGGSRGAKVLEEGGAGVRALVDAGDWTTLEAYAKDDAVKTAAIWARVQQAVRW